MGVRGLFYNEHIRRVKIFYFSPIFPCHGCGVPPVHGLAAVLAAAVLFPSCLARLLCLSPWKAWSLPLRKGRGHGWYVVPVLPWQQSISVLSWTIDRWWGILLIHPWWATMPWRGCSSRPRRWQIFFPWWRPPFWWLPLPAWLLAQVPRYIRLPLAPYWRGFQV